MITFDLPLWIILQALAATFLPLLVGLVTTRTTNAGVKAVLLAALAVVIALVSQVADALQYGKPYNLGIALVTAAVSFAISVGTHFGIWKPTGTAHAAQRVGTGRHVN
ncbi:hypothetical protein [Renibacterium salmoninarum]|nr:hypothetical protein [Renibacterium salmoninarum]